LAGKDFGAYHHKEININLCCNFKFNYHLETYLKLKSEKSVFG